MRIDASVARALIVEDHPVNQLLLSKLLSKFGMHHIDVAENGQIALTMLKENAHYDIVFMDCQMPVLDGYEATRAIRNHEEMNPRPAP